MQFDDLQHFLTVRPSGILEKGDDRVATPFRLPGAETPISVWVRRMEGGRCFVHDRAEAAKAVKGFGEILQSKIFEPVRTAWIDSGVQVDEEGEIFTIAGAGEQPLIDAVSRIIEAQIVIGALGAAWAAHSGGSR